MLVAAITDVRNFEVTVQTELIREGYLGERTNRRDDIFNGVAGKLEIHSEDGSVLDLFTTLINRAKSRNPGIVINIDAQLTYPGGDQRHVSINDVYFGELPMNIGARGEYVSFTINFEASEYQEL